MAGNDDGHGVASIGKTDRTRRGGPSNRSGELSVGACRAGRDLPESAPDRLLKLRATRIHLDLVESVKIARELGLDLSPRAERILAMKLEALEAA
jgi:hypothetical protein